MKKYCKECKKETNHTHDGNCYRCESKRNSLGIIMSCENCEMEDCKCLKKETENLTGCIICFSCALCVECQGHQDNCPNKEL